MATWTYPPASLEGNDAGVLPTVFSEVMCAITRRNSDFQDSPTEWFDSLSSPTPEQVEGNVYPQVYGDWLSTIRSEIDTLASNQTAAKSGEWWDGDTYRYMSTDTTPFTSASLHIAALSSPNWTTISDKPRNWAIFKALEEAMLCLDELYLIRIGASDDGPPGETSGRIDEGIVTYSGDENSISDAFNDLFSNYDEYTDWNAILAGAGLDVMFVGFGQEARRYDAVPDNYYYYIIEWFFTIKGINSLGSHFELKSTSAHKLYFGDLFEDTDDSGDPTDHTITVYGDCTWGPTLTTADFDNGGGDSLGTLETDGAASQSVSLSKTDYLDQATNYFWIQPPLTEEFTTIDNPPLAGVNKVGFGKDIVSLDHPSGFLFLYDLKDASKP